MDSDILNSSKSLHDHYHMMDDVTHKMVFITILGNSNDLDGLLELLSTEKNERVLMHLVTVIGALGEQRSLPYLESLLGAEISPRISKLVVNAITVIQSMNSYI